MPNLHLTHTVGDARRELIVGAQSSGGQPNVVAAQSAEGPHGAPLSLRAAHVVTSLNARTVATAEGVDAQRWAPRTSAEGCCRTTR
jgi:hypothetical protein